MSVNVSIDGTGTIGSIIDGITAELYRRFPGQIQTQEFIASSVLQAVIKTDGITSISTIGSKRGCHFGTPKNTSRIAAELAGVGVGAEMAIER